MNAPAELRNPYKGSPARATLQLRLLGLDGRVLELELMADTGNPFALVVPESDMADFRIHDAPSIDTNFGILTGGWLRVSIPALGFDEEVLAYASDNVAAMTRKCHLTLEGLAGLPLLRMFEFGGDADWFWLRRNV